MASPDPFSQFQTLLHWRLFDLEATRVRLAPDVLGFLDSNAELARSTGFVLYRNGGEREALVEASNVAFSAKEREDSFDVVPVALQEMLASRQAVLEHRYAENAEELERTGDSGAALWRASIDSRDDRRFTASALGRLLNAQGGVYAAFWLAHTARGVQRQPHPMAEVW